jgi:hypothetical protein
MKNIMDYEADALANIIFEDNSYEEELALFEINQLKERKEGIKSLMPNDKNSYYLNQTNALIRKAYKRLGQIKLNTANNINRLNYAYEASKLYDLERYLGKNVFHWLLNMCGLKRKYCSALCFRFINHAIKDFIPSNGLNFDETISVQTETWDNKKDYKLCNDRQIILKKILDDNICRLLDFSFNGDWGKIDEFCTETITMQIDVKSEDGTNKSSDESP